MIIHISQQRYEFIKSQGYTTYFVAESGGHQGRKRYHDGDNEFHLLDDEYAFCKTCGEPFDSVDANTPAELETIKACPERAVIALRNMRQENAVHYKELCLRGAA